MTTIAFDGRTLAADRQCTDQFGLVTSTTKIWRVGQFLFAASGSNAAIQEFKYWFENGGDPAKFPEKLRDSDKASAHVMTIDPKRVIRVYENSPFPFIVERTRHAMGSGRDFAFMAMRLGKGASDAVALSCEFDSGSGQGVDTLELILE